MTEAHRRLIAAAEAAHNPGCHVRHMTDGRIIINRGQAMRVTYPTDTTTEVARIARHLGLEIDR